LTALIRFYMCVCLYVCVCVCVCVCVSVCVSYLAVTTSAPLTQLRRPTLTADVLQLVRREEGEPVVRLPMEGYLRWAESTRGVGLWSCYFQEDVHLTLSCPVLSYPVLSYPVLSGPVL